MQSKKTPFVVISQQSKNSETMALHRYEGKTHVGQLEFSLAEIESHHGISALANEYRVHGNKLFVESDNEPTEPEAA